MTFNIICVGAVKDRFYKDACAEYLKRMQAFCSVNVTETKAFAPKSDSAADRDKALELEAEAYKKHIKGYFIAADVGGEKLTSEGFAQLIADKQMRGVSEISILIGGSTGISREVRDSADYKLSFSDMTFPHTLFRVMLLEQLYRAHMLMAGRSYHK